MADKKASEVSVERIYTIPLKKGVLRVSAGKRSNRAVSEIKRFLEKHMKCDDARVSPKVNDFIWRRGDGKPPSRIKVKARLDGGIAMARLPDELVIEKKEKKAAGGFMDKAKAIRGGASAIEMAKDVKAGKEPQEGAKKEEKAAAPKQEKKAPAEQEKPKPDTQKPKKA